MTLAALFLLTCAAVPGQGLRFAKAIPLPGVNGRIDHLACDPASQILYVAALGNNTLEVIDLRAGKRAHSVPGFHEPQGIALDAAARRVYVANGGDGRLRILDAATLAESAALELGDDADNVRYDRAANRIWAGYGTGALAEIDPALARRIGEVKLAAHPESFQLEKTGPRIFVNVPNAGHIAVIDRQTRSLVAKWPVEGAAANFPMALDEADRRLFMGCRKPAKVLVYDTATGKKVTEFPCVGDTDDLFYDAARRRVYAAGGEGFLSVYRQDSPDRYTGLGKIATAPGARTGLYVPELSTFYLAVPHRGAQACEIRAYTAE